MPVLRAIAHRLVLTLDALGDWLKSGFPSRILLNFLIATEPDNR